MYYIYTIFILIIIDIIHENILITTQRGDGEMLTKKGKLAVTMALALLGMVLVTKPAAAVAVDMELILMVDSSFSIDSAEFTLERQGYVDAFKNAAIYNAIQQGANGSIAVSLIYWAGGFPDVNHPNAVSQVLAVDWMLINSQSTSEAFADAVMAATRPTSAEVGTLTAIGDAFLFSYPKFTNGFEGTRRVIDVSGDGVRNFGAQTNTSRDTALANGVTTVNGITIIDEFTFGSIRHFNWFCSAPGNFHHGAK